MNKHERMVLEYGDLLNRAPEGMRPDELELQQRRQSSMTIQPINKVNIDQVPRCKTCSELCDSADGDNRCYNPLNSGIGESDESIKVDPKKDFCSYHSQLRTKKARRLKP
jgi:hypothetical protein